MPKVSEDVLRATVEEMADAQMTATLHRLAKGLPVFDATFGTGRMVDVVHAGTIA